MQEKIKIRQHEFDNADAAASFFNVSRQWVLEARRLGRLDRIGLGRGGGQVSKVEIRGEVYDGFRKAGQALGVSAQAVWSAVECGRPDGAGLGRPWASRGLSA